MRWWEVHVRHAGKEEKNAYKILTERKTLRWRYGRPRCRWKKHIKTSLKRDKAPQHLLRPDIILQRKSKWNVKKRLEKTGNLAVFIDIRSICSAQNRTTKRQHTFIMIKPNMQYNNTYNIFLQINFFSHHNSEKGVNGTLYLQTRYEFRFVFRPSLWSSFRATLHLTRETG